MLIAYGLSGLCTQALGTVPAKNSRSSRPPDSLGVRFGQAVRTRRTELGLTQERVAEAARMDRSYLADIEAGRRNPSLDVLAKIAHGLDTNLATLFADL